MSHVRYIDRTRDYYRNEGYDRDYEWAANDDIPFTRLARPLSDCRVALVSTSDIGVRAPDGSRDRENEFGVGNVYSLRSDTPLDLLYSRQEHFDQHATTLDDINSFFPVSRLHELADSGRIGSVASECIGVYTAYSQRKTNERDAPEVLRRLRDDDVDVVLLTPV
jgi:hypothetical protein